MTPRWPNVKLMLCVLLGMVGGGGCGLFDTNIQGRLPSSTAHELQREQQDDKLSGNNRIINISYVKDRSFFTIELQSSYVLIAISMIRGHRKHILPNLSLHSCIYYIICAAAPMPSLHHVYHFVMQSKCDVEKETSETT